MGWQENFQKEKEIILATVSPDGIPNANIVTSLGFVDGKLLIKDSQMNTTLKNLQSNKNICIIGGYFRIKGEAEIFSEGKYFDLCFHSDMTYPPKNAILVIIKEVFDLNNVKVVNKN
ncbi:MAG: pyridoxamine 5'-phosphate oxidase family protein [Patescibacteria group bacterium]|nr:pyridoxamine 5'-phosphate oxidase family protein [Patescibacteria group bacterium]MDD4611167.1 pyridoxamine 5'-phosphate oxidase family protein [Patescibacteria group bacterium]